MDSALPSGAAGRPPSQALPRPTLGKALARRLDRLAFRAHAFHRWAHHPLCREYEGEVFRMGRRFRLCRGCTLAALGGLGGLAAGGAAPFLSALPLFVLAALGAAAGLASLGSWRLPKALGRAAPAALPPFLFLQALRSGRPMAWGLAAGATVAVGAAVFAYRRRGPDRTPCRSCPEFGEAGVCRGFREIRGRERAFARLAARWLRSQDPVR